MCLTDFSMSAILRTESEKMSLRSPTKKYLDMNTDKYIFRLMTHGKAIKYSSVTKTALNEPLYCSGIKSAKNIMMLNGGDLWEDKGGNPYVQDFMDNNREYINPLIQKIRTIDLPEDIGLSVFVLEKVY